MNEAPISTSVIAVSLPRAAGMCVLSRYFIPAGMLIQPVPLCQPRSCVGQPNTAAASDAGTVLVGLEADGANAVGGKLLVAILGVAGDADGADDFAVGSANLQPAAFRKDLVAARAQQIAHEDRLLLCAHFHEL